jgi:N-acetylneuraminic acid mutarotase
VEAFDTARNTWSTVAPLPQPLYHVSMVSMDGKLYAIGGLEGLGQTPVDTVYIYDPEVGSWEAGVALPHAIGGAAALVRHGKIHLLGGRMPTGISDSHLIYDPDLGGWSYGEGLLGPRAYHGAASLDGRIIVFGGRSGSLAANLRTVSELQDRASNWEKVGFMNTKRSSFGTVSSAGKVYVFGGETVAASLDSVEAYDIATGQWKEVTPMPTGRHGLAAVAVGGKIFVIGGGQRAGISVSDVNEVFIPSGYIDDSGPEGETSEEE